MRKPRRVRRSLPKPRVPPVGPALGANAPQRTNNSPCYVTAFDVTFPKRYLNRQQTKELTGLEWKTQIIDPLTYQELKVSLNNTTTNERANWFGFENDKLLNL